MSAAKKSQKQHSSTKSAAEDVETAEDSEAGTLFVASGPLEAVLARFRKELLANLSPADLKKDVTLTVAESAFVQHGEAFKRALLKIVKES